MQEHPGVPFTLAHILSWACPELTPEEIDALLKIAPGQRALGRTQTAFRAALARNLRIAFQLLRIRRPDLMHIGAHPWDNPTTAMWHLVWTPSKEEQQ